GETKLPEHPPASRTEDSCASFSHWASGAKRYFCCTFFEGKLSNVHIPSSARAAKARASVASKVSLFIGASPGEERANCSGIAPLVKEIRGARPRRAGRPAGRAPGRSPPHE